MSAVPEIPFAIETIIETRVLYVCPTCKRPHTLEESAADCCRCESCRIWPGFKLGARRQCPSCDRKFEIQRAKDRLYQAQTRVRQIREDIAEAEAELVQATTSFAKATEELACVKLLPTNVQRMKGER